MTSDSYGQDPEGPGPVQPTGNPTVDAVLESLGRLDGTHVSEHVAVFESAHENLRSVLAGASDHQSS